MYIGYPRIIIACQKHTVLNKPPCKVQNFFISPLTSNKPPCQISKWTISPRRLTRRLTIQNKMSWSHHIFFLGYSWSSYLLISSVCYAMGWLFNAGCQCLHNHSIRWYFHFQHIYHDNCNNWPLWCL